MMLAVSERCCRTTPTIDLGNFRALHGLCRTITRPALANERVM